MRNDLTYDVMRRRLIDAAREDTRIVGLICDGSHSSGRGDQWSDVDVSIFIQDDAFDDFALGWRTWASSLGDLLLGYISWVGHPWAVYDAALLPLRVDFDLHRASAIDQVADWPVNLTSVDTAVWYDDSDGKLRAAAGNLVSKSLAPSDSVAEFERLCGDVWYELLYVYSRLRRGEERVARQAFHSRLIEPLLRLLRFEAGAFERWQASPAATDIERVLSPKRIEQLNACIPGVEAAALLTALRNAANLGAEVCASIAAQRECSWPERLASRVVETLAAVPQPEIS